MVREKSNNEFEFLHDMDEYIEKIENVSDQSQYISDPSCVSVEKKDISQGILKNHICEKFNKLYTLLCNRESDTCKDNYYLFLNFWLNNSLYSIGELGKIDIKLYFQKLKHNVNGLSHDVKLETSLSKIKTDLLENMNILYNLHTNFRKIYSGDTVVCNDRTTCLNYYNICVEEYKKGIIKCSNNGNNFCKEVNVFKNLYNQFKVILLSSDKFKSSDLLDLPTYTEVANELSKKYTKKLTIMICSIFGPVLGIIILWICIKKLTSFGKRGNIVKGKDKRNNSTIDIKTEHMLFDPSYTGEADVKREKYKIPYNNVGNY